MLQMMLHRYLSAERGGVIDLTIQDELCQGLLV